MSGWAEAEFNRWHEELDQSALEAEGLKIVASLVNAQLDHHAAAVSDSLARHLTRKREGVFAAIDVVLDGVNGHDYTDQDRDVFERAEREVESSRCDYLTNVMEAAEALEATTAAAE